MRPTSAKVRQAIFNILGNIVSGARVLDLFAGAGTLALEALSRGAAEAVLVEENSASLLVLQRNVKTLGVQQRVTIMPMPVQSAVRKLEAQGELFNLIFLDPPYELRLAAKTLNLLGVSAIVATPAWVVAEHSPRETLPETTISLHLSDTRRYGDTQVSFYTGHGKTDSQESSP